MGLSPGHCQRQYDFWGTCSWSCFFFFFFKGNSDPWWPEMEQPTIRDNPMGIIWGGACTPRKGPWNGSDLNLEGMSPSEANALHRMVHYTPAAISTLLSPWWVGMVVHLGGHLQDLPRTTGY